MTRPITPNMWVRQQSPSPAPGHPGVVLPEEFYVWEMDGSMARVSRKTPVAHEAELQPLEWLPIEQFCAVEDQPPMPPCTLLLYGPIVAF